MYRYVTIGIKKLNNAKFKQAPFHLNVRVAVKMSANRCLHREAEAFKLHFLTRSASGAAASSRDPLVPHAQSERGPKELFEGALLICVMLLVAFVFVEKPVSSRRA